MIRRRKPPVFGLLLVAALCPHGARSAVTVGDWSPIYRGVEHATGEADAAEPRLQKVNAVRIDLDQPGIAVYTTPSNGAGADETDGQTTSEFVIDSNVQVAVNANFFNPALPPPFGSSTKDLEGLAVSEGNVVSPQETDPVANRGQVLLLTADNVAWMDSTLNNPISLFGVHTAVCGDARVLTGGVITVAAGGEAHPRTLVGLTSDSRYLLLVTIDGRQTGYSEGATLYEAAEWLIRYGAYDGIALDGGGSTTMARSDGAGGAAVLNAPMGAGWFGNSAGERMVGNNLGVYAAFLAGDMNGDSDVDSDDFDFFVSCLAGPASTTPPPGCSQTTFDRADIDGDGNVDLSDFAEFQLVFDGP